ncbi:glycoside hydrolase family 17 protein [Sporormia fimetaria CBS 119925]|uniref:Glycoside hydrolase family 17 protein n=1 Tax=Sporormia fimetaria CBS 119925 TaxID=1340428 RepID=A0A6A6VQZ5_9PLEO|nr:glycoside hydrolase family 17 protein [Sporormia fimetaria CBS 119925]
MYLNMFWGALALVGFASAYPHEVKRALVTEVTTTTVYLANAIVYIDRNGVPLHTQTIHLADSAQSDLAKSTTTEAESAGVTPTPEAESPAEGNVDDSTPSPPADSEQESPVVSDTTTTTTSTAEASSSPSPSPQAQEEEPQPPVEESPSPSPSPQAPVDETPTPSPSPQAPAEETPQSPVEEPQSSTTTTASEPSETPAAPEDQPPSGDRFPTGITYDPFKSGGCKTPDEVRGEWQQITQYGIIRLYGMGCGIVPLAVELAKKNNQKVFAGIWMATGQDNEDMDTVVNEIANAVKKHAGGDWSVIGLVSVSNERIHQGTHTASHIVDAIRRTREALRAKGYNGPVGAVETVGAMLDNTAICEASDIALVNAHSFFDPHTKAEDSGKFMRGQVSQVEDACKKRTVVTEAGWPHTGEAHDQAVPSRANQQLAIESIKREFPGDVFLFNAFDCPWKTDFGGSYGAERYWGLH